MPGLKWMGITFIMSGLMAMAFQGFTGIKLASPTKEIIDQGIVKQETIQQ